MPPNAQVLPYIANTAAAIALIPSIAGGAGLFYPNRGIKQLGLTGEATERELGLFKMYACRQCAGGLISLVMWYTGSYRAMGLAGFAGLLLAITDGFVINKLVSQKEAWNHWGATPIGLGLSTALVYYTS